MATVDLGKIKFTWRGAFSTSNTYEADDVVSHSGSSWVYVNTTSKTGTNAGAPSSTNTTHWNVMAQGTGTLTTSGDLLTHNGSVEQRVPIGSTGQILKASGTSITWSNSDAFYQVDVLGSNVPLYANTFKATTDEGTDGKRPWLAEYNGKSGASADWIPYDGMPNPECGPVKRARNDMHCNTPTLCYLNGNYEPLMRGYNYYSAAPLGNAAADNVVLKSKMSMEFGGLKSGEYFVRMWNKGGTSWALTNKGNMFVTGENGSGELGLGDTVDRYQWVKNPYFGPDATNNSVTCEIACIVPNWYGGYQWSTNIRVFVILHDGRVMAFGHNAQGQLGDGTSNARSVPTVITGITNVKMISAGLYCTWVVDGSGNLFHCGSDTNGVGGGSARTAFAQLTGVSNVEQAELHCMGYYSSGVSAQGYVIQANGDLFSIGYNGNGQLGIGNTTNQSAFQQVGGSENFSAVQVTGNAQTSSAVLWLGNSDGGNANTTDGPGDMYHLTVANNTGNGFRMVGYNANGAQLQGNTTGTTGVNIPSTASFDTYQHYTVNSSADGTISKTALVFPSTTMKACFPMRTSGYNTPGWYGLDTQGRLWLWGYHSTAHPYQATTSATNYYGAFLYPSPWNHTESSGSSYIGNTDIAIEDFLSVGHYYSGYWTHYVRTSDGTVYGYGNNYYFNLGSTVNTMYNGWHRLRP